MTPSNRTADLLAAFRDHHLQPQGGPASLDQALGWWNRGWVTPGSFDPLTWVPTLAGCSLLDREGPDLTLPRPLHDQAWLTMHPAAAARLTEHASRPGP